MVKSKSRSKFLSRFLRFPAYMQWIRVRPDTRLLRDLMTSSLSAIWLSSSVLIKESSFPGENTCDVS